MIETLNVIYEGSETLIKNKRYFSTKAYIEPFVEKLKPYTNKIICAVKVADQLSTEDSKIHTIYNKVMIMGIFPDKYDVLVNTNDKPITYHRVVCMAYSLDTRTPICKFYTGVVDIHGVFYAFGPDCIQIQKIEPETAIDYSGVQGVINAGLNDNCREILQQNVTRVLPKSEMFNTLGSWIDFTLKKEYINDSGKIKLSNTLPIEAYKLLTLEKDSDYYTERDSSTYSEILGALCSIVHSDDKDIINRYEKTQLINQMLKL